MGWANPDAPNQPDFYLFVQNEMGVPASALPNPTVANPPAAPALTPGGGGSLPAGPVFVVVTYVSAYGETTGSIEASATVGANGSLSVASPPAVAFATGFNVYAASLSTGEVIQGSAPTPIGTPFVLTALAASNATPPTVNTTGWTWPSYALKRAQRLVLQVPTVDGTDYALATYNCAGHLLLGTAPDTATTYKDGQGFFAFNRSQFDMNEAQPGVISSSADQGTSNSMAVPEQLQNLTVGDLWFYTTPWGRAYLAFAQDFGQIAGLS